MSARLSLTHIAACALVAGAACTKQAPSPSSPTASQAVVGAVGPNGETLKATSPEPRSPLDSVQLETPDVTLVIENSTTPNIDGVPLRYRFEVINSGGSVVYSAGDIPAGAGGTTSHTVTAILNAQQPYSWQARAEYEGAFGPWSGRGSFIAPATNGYIRGNELYDPLINGMTVGQVHGDVTLIPGRGVRLNSQLGYVSYELPQTLTEGEFSLLTSELRTNTEGTKTKLFAMAEGYADIVTNDRRMTVEKRGDPAGIIAWRFITHDDAVDTEGAEREFRSFNESLDYFWQATWRNNFFNVRIREGGVDGPIIYDKGKHFDGIPYDPSPHVIYVGAPEGRSGPEGASVDGVIIRQVWVSSRPRPSFANK